MKIDFDLDTRESIRTFVRQELWNIIDEGMWHERHRVEEASSNQSTSHDHVPVPPDVLESRRRVAREGGGLRLHDGSRNVHPGGCESEHRMLDGGASRKEINAESSFVEKFGVGSVERLKDLVYPEGAITPDMMFSISLPIESWAAIVLEHMHEGFAVSERGRAAQGAHDYIRRSLNDILPNWMETIWSSENRKSSR